MIKGASMFCSAGIAETYFLDAGIEIVVANELIEKRAKFYEATHPHTKVVVGDINDNKVYKEFETYITSDIEFLIATPPCQGASTLGVNKKDLQMQSDPRNYLIFNVIQLIEEKDFNYIFIENVPRFLDVLLPYQGKFLRIADILRDKFAQIYNIDIDVLNAEDYGVPQSRPRAIVRMWKKGLSWQKPSTQNKITLEKAIGHLPSLESGQSSGIKWHYAKEHNDREVLCMKHTPTGQSALINDFYYPRKKDGTKIKGFHNTYKRMRWDSPAPARTMNNGNIGSHNNVHPGRLLEDGTYSDARVLTMLELFIVSSLPEDWNTPEWASDSFVRQIIGEAIPPRLALEIVKGIGIND